MEPVSDEALMEAYRSGEEAAFEALYQRHAPRVYGYLIKRVGNRAKADELLQTIFMKLHQYRDRYESSLLFTPWLFTICRNVLIDAARRGNVFEQGRFASFDEEKHDQADEPEEITAGVDLKALDNQKRQALEMRYLDQLSYEAIAKRLGISETSARQRVSRAIKKLRSNVKGNKRSRT